MANVRASELLTDISHITPPALRHRSNVIGGGLRDGHLIVRPGLAGAHDVIATGLGQRCILVVTGLGCGHLVGTAALIDQHHMVRAGLSRDHRVVNTGLLGLERVIVAVLRDQGKQVGAALADLGRVADPTLLQCRCIVDARLAYLEGVAIAALHNLDRAVIGRLDDNAGRDAVETAGLLEHDAAADPALGDCGLIAYARLGRCLDARTEPVAGSRLINRDQIATATRAVALRERRNATDGIIPVCCLVNGKVVGCGAGANDGCLHGKIRKHCNNTDSRKKNDFHDPNPLLLLMAATMAQELEDRL